MGDVFARRFDQTAGILGVTDHTLVQGRILVSGGPDGKTPEGVGASPELVGADPKGTAQGLINGLDLDNRFNTKADKTDVAESFGIVGNTLNALSEELDGKVGDDDSRLSDARPPTAHNHPISDVANLQSSLNAKLNSDDVSVTNARTPTAHAASHASGGTDPLELAQSQIIGLLTAMNAKYDKSGGPITGSVTVNNNGTFRQDHTNAAAGNYAALFHVTSSQYAINKHTATGPAWIIVDPRPTDGASDALVQLFRNTNINPATGSAALRILLGNGSATVNTQLGGNTDTILNASTGNVAIGGTSASENLDCYKKVRFREVAQLGSYTVATLPNAALHTGCLAYTSNGRKVGQGSGAGTGVPVYSDGAAWRVFSTDATVTA